MANNERLTKRVKKIEDWVAENEEMGGPQGTLYTLVSLINQNKSMGEVQMKMKNEYTNMRNFMFEFLQDNKLQDEWNEFLQEKEDNKDAVQEQQTEEVPLQEEAESGEEAVEAPIKEKNSKKKK